MSFCFGKAQQLPARFAFLHCGQGPVSTAGCVPPLFAALTIVMSVDDEDADDEEDDAADNDKRGVDDCDDVGDYDDDDCDDDESGNGGRRKHGSSDLSSCEMHGSSPCRLPC